MMSKLDSIPWEMRQLHQWVMVAPDCKIPMNEEGFASTSCPETWTDFESARHWAEATNGNVGFVFHNNGIVGIDIDAGYDDGLISPLAADVINACRSYTEHSRSGRGFHILLKGQLPFDGKNNRNGVEIYQTGRYFITTGDTLLFPDLIENQAAIDYVVETYFQDTLRDGGSSGGRVYSPQWELPKNGRVKLRPVYPRIPDGCRNICLTSLAGMMHNQGYGRQHIYEELTYANVSACDPSLDDSEVRSIVNSVTRYKR